MNVKNHLQRQQVRDVQFGIIVIHVNFEKLDNHVSQPMYVVVTSLTMGLKKWGSIRYSCVLFNFWAITDVEISFCITSRNSWRLTCWNISILLPLAAPRKLATCWSQHISASTDRKVIFSFPVSEWKNRSYFSTHHKVL